MIGRLVYRYQRRFGDGFQTAWFRDRVRCRILETEPVKPCDDKNCEIHVLTSDSDWLNLMWALKSFYRVCERRYALCIHDDGTLTDEIRDLLGHHFPEARIVCRNASDEAVLDQLKAFPRCAEFRRTNHLAPKIFDFRHYLQTDRMLLLDSDVLFFREPTELLRRIESRDYLRNSVNRDVATAYTVDKEVAEQQCNLKLIDRFNSGLGLIHKNSLDLDWIEEFLALPDVLQHFWRIEQTIFALCSSRFGVELLPDDYDVRLDGNLGDCPVRHYVGPIRHLMYSEGMRKVAGDLSVGRWL